MLLKENINGFKKTLQEKDTEITVSELCDH